jgi:TonB-linked SusC/RagA family outer membrane protein
MRITSFFIVAFCLQLSATGLSQRITLSLKQAPLAKVFDEISHQTGLSVVYREDLLKGAKPVTVEVKEATVEEVMNACFADQPLVYKINGTTVVVQPKPVVEATPQPPPPVTLTGIVSDSKGAPLSEVSIMIKGTSTGVTTDRNGKFSIQLPNDNATLVFSLVGFASQEIRVRGKTTISITLREKPSPLDEIVVVGYGTRKRSDITGAVSSVSEKELRNIPAGNFGTILQGAAAGVSVLKGGGNNYPGSTPTIRVRGERSLGAGNDPLIILDGVPFAGSLNDIAPDEIVSAEVLKDASSTAIYGSRGSNGVILVQTRRGKTQQKPVVTYGGYAGFNKVLGHYDVMNANEFLTFRKWAKINGSPAGTYSGLDDPNLVTAGTLGVFSDPKELQLYQAGTNTDWQSLLYKTAPVTNHQVGITGGTETTQYDVSLGYYDAGGIYPGQNMQRYNLKISIDHSLGKLIKVGLSTLESYSYFKGPNINPVNYFLQASPFSVPYNPDGTLATYLPGSNQNVFNPMTDFVAGAVVDDDKRHDNFTTAYLDLNLTHGFKYRLNAGLEMSPETIGKFYASNTTKQAGTQNYGFNSNSTGYNYTVENILTYDKTIGKDHSINFTGLYSLQKTQTENNSVTYRNVLADYIQYYNPQYATNITSQGTYSKWTILSYMGRLNYKYKDRYLATFTIRDDGSSRLANGNKWHTFPSGALAWNIAKESFLNSSKHVSALKLRASYGTTANTSISPYQTVGALAGVYYNFGSDNVQGTYPDPSHPGNITLGWENTSSLNFGLDYGLFNNRILGSVEWYKQVTDDILLSQSLPATSGYRSIINNIGQTQNTGMEFSVTSVNLPGHTKGSLSWTTNVNVFFNRGRINKLSSGALKDINNGWFVGSPNHVYYDYKRVGIWQNTPGDLALAQKYGLTTTQAAYTSGPNSLVGTVRVADVNGDGKITADDKVIVGGWQPKVEGGVTNTFNYENFDLTVVTYFKVGGTLQSAIHNGFANSFQAGYNNLDVKYWTPANGANYWPKPNSTLQFPTYLSALSYFDASYLKIRTITLGYTLPVAIAQKLTAKSLRVYATASNPFTFFSPYKRDAKGLDPETSSNIDVNKPSLWSLLFGLNVSF